MLDDLIRQRTGAASATEGQRVARTVQRVARAFAVPALVLMVLGLVLFLTVHPGAGGLPGEAVVNVRRLASRTLLTPRGVMSLGLLLLALIPMVTVLLIVSDRLRHRQWTEAAIGLGVVSILMIGILLSRGE